MSTPERPQILPLVFDAVSFEAGGRALLRDLNFRLEPGPISVILGPNGSGKTLLLRLCDGLLTPSRGRVTWTGKDPAQAAAARALVFQRPVLLRRSAAANIDYALRLRGAAAAERERRVERALSDTRLLHLADQPARQMSVGEQQRLAMARAWATDPSVLFLDEPAAALDPGSRRALEDSILAIHQAGTKIVLTTHDLAQAERLAGEVLFLLDGELIEQTTAQTFFGGGASPNAQRFMEGEVL